jgi:predicted small integral membrane protein
MMTRIAKLCLLASVALFYTFVVFNNLTDYNSNFQFVRHVLAMDTIFPGNPELWRSLPTPGFHYVFYNFIIGWEVVTAILCWWGALSLLKALRAPASAFQSAKRIPIAALTLSLLMWLVAFLTVGAEWFLMWQSRQWNGQEEAFRMFAVVGIVLLLMIQPEMDGQP